MVFFLTYFGYGGMVVYPVVINTTVVPRRIDASAPFTCLSSFHGTRVQSYSKKSVSVVLQMVGSNSDALL